jgi:hypothetical protein
MGGGGHTAERMGDEKQELECESQKEKKGNERRNMKRKLKLVCNRPIRNTWETLCKRRGLRKLFGFAGIQDFLLKFYPRAVFWTSHRPQFSVLFRSRVGLRIRTIPYVYFFIWSIQNSLCGYGTAFFCSTVCIYIWKSMKFKIKYFWSFLAIPAFSLLLHNTLRAWIFPETGTD